MIDNNLQNNNTAQNQVQFDISALEVDGDLVNLTKLAKAANKRLDVWLKTDKTKRFLEAFSKLTPNGGIQVKLGKNQEQGTYAHRKVALKFAEWVSVDFEIWVNDKIDTLLQKGKVELTTQTKSEQELFAEAIMKGDLTIAFTLNNKFWNQKLAETKNEIINQIVEIKPVFETAKKLIGESPTMTNRKELVRIVNQIAELKKISQQQVWKKLYDEFYYRPVINGKGLNLKSRAENSKKSKIEILEELNLFDMAKSILLDIYKDVLA